MVGDFLNTRRHDRQPIKYRPLRKNPTVVGCSLTFSCTPKDVKVHTDDNGAIVLLTNRTSF